MTVTDAERRGFARWCRYYADTEDFDLSLPHRPGRGCVTPLPEYMAASSKYARRLWLTLMLDSTVPGQADALHLPHAQQRHYAATDEQLGLATGWVEMTGSSGWP